MGPWSDGILFCQDCTNGQHEGQWVQRRLPIGFDRKAKGAAFMNAQIRNWGFGLACLATLASAPAMSADAGRAGTWETRLGILFTLSENWDFEGGTTADIKSDQ